MGAPFLGQVVLGCIRRLAKHKLENRQTSKQAAFLHGFFCTSLAVSEFLGGR